MSAAAPIEVARAAYRAYLAQDRPAMERLLADEFAFTSPNDDHIDRAAFLARCFPTADRFTAYELVHLADVGEGRVLALYEYELAAGGRYRNAERLTVRDGQLVETEVFFGGQV